MLTNIQKLNMLIKRISKIPEDKLKELDDFVFKLEQNTPAKNRTLSFAGAWQDLDNSVFGGLTENLIDRKN